MVGIQHEKQRWGVILAGGDGTRLRSLTQRVSDDNRPKQFCPLLGGKTLLAQTRLRVGANIHSSRTLFVLTRKHEPFYAAELENVPPSRMVIQPCNRGTLPAILWSLLRIIRQDEHASVVFFPSDHYYSHEEKFIEGVKSALDAAAGDPCAVMLLAAAPTQPEVEYGWIEPDRNTASRSGAGLMRVKRFWEKPASQTAERLLAEGCLWNTFVMAGSAGAFIEMIRQAVPGLYHSFEAALSVLDGSGEDAVMQSVYDKLPSADFSREVLSVSTKKLTVASLGDIGWSDLGDPHRLITTLFKSGIENPWVAAGSCSFCGEALSVF